jgi:phosphatidylserine/phosphatidylglycerophosphate/cardiolipin synthase-like enzyme
MRRTDQALTDLIREARESIVIVSFVVYKVPHVAAALGEAVSRGVAVTLILETEDDSQGKVLVDGFEQLQSAGLQGTAQYVWPDECRGKSKDGRVGSLHAKCAVADRRLALVSSANLTDYGLSLNMELGLMVEGGSIPSQIVAHFEFLISAGILVRRN